MCEPPPGGGGDGDAGSADRSTPVFIGGLVAGASAGDWTAFRDLVIVGKPQISFAFFEVLHRRILCGLFRRTTTIPAKQNSQRPRFPDEPTPFPARPIRNHVIPGTLSTSLELRRADFVAAIFRKT